MISRLVVVTIPSRRYCAKAYSTTSPRPIRPAIRPICSWSAPRVAETCCSEATSNSSGRAPKRSWSDSCVAVSWVKLPRMEASPPGEGSCTWGAEITRPSSTMPNMSVAP